MKRLLLATVALAALSVPAMSADLATKYPVKAVAVVPVFSWTGFYIGANAGYGGDKFTLDEVNTYYGDYYSSESRSVNSSGFFVGGQIGYNYQFANNVVVGVETDLQWTNIEGKYTESYANYWGGLSNYSSGASVDYFGTIRARLGYAFDRFLPYITGGAAYGKTAYDISNFYVGEGYDVWGGSASSTKWGWTIGAGVEYAITNNWTFKTEYLYVDLGSTDFSYFGTYYDGSTNFNDIYSGSVDTKFHTLKAGVNYKF
ncbi:outer membrane protein [Xanthobacter autotrophicus]|uniref:outer membrane protein n=1 Tax=Xanthobacter autotrophicus TaxID=280 RepID=UPI0024A71B54|nr:outer membrane beta-barrel protein [Xanthobacter autotrophicus]MDI4655787.1 outer membrane beta-barrel protein [Xanthobacter autotrophicus]